MLKDLIAYKKWIDGEEVTPSWSWYIADIWISIITFGIMWIVLWDGAVNVSTFLWVFLTFPLPLHVANVICFLLWRKQQ